MYTTIRPKSGSFLLVNLFTYNCINILYATFMAVLIYISYTIFMVALILYVVRYIHGYMKSQPVNWHYLLTKKHASSSRCSFILQINSGQTWNEGKLNSINMSVATGIIKQRIYINQLPSCACFSHSLYIQSIKRNTIWMNEWMNENEWENYSSLK